MVELHHQRMDMSLTLDIPELVVDREAWRAAMHAWGSKQSDTTE